MNLRNEIDNFKEYTKPKNRTKKEENVLTHKSADRFRKER